MRSIEELGFELAWAMLLLTSSLFLGELNKSAFIDLFKFDAVGATTFALGEDSSRALILFMSTSMHSETISPNFKLTSDVF